MFRLIGLLAVLFFALDYYTEGESSKMLREYTDTFVHEAKVAYIMQTKGITSVQCADLVPVMKGIELQNTFGAKFDILYINSDKMSEASRTDTTLICFAEAKLTNGDARLKLTLEILDGKEWIYSAEQVF